MSTFVRHIKSGGIYEIVCHAQMESSGEMVVVYRGRTGQNWVRPVHEMAARFVDATEEEFRAELTDQSGG